jgi:NADPH:quinone reductase-like Zn-dependent oxidoreductase
MTRRNRWLLIIAAIVILPVIAVRLALGRDTPCPAPIASAATTATPAGEPGAAGSLARAIVYRCYGPPSVLALESVTLPELESARVRVRVHAAAVNPLDWHYMRGEPRIMRLESGIGAPKDTRMGADFSGTVVAVGRDVRRFKVGDEVFGSRGGAFGEYVDVREAGGIALKPAGVSHEQAAALPVAGVTALQALRDKGGLRAGQKVLINGASGGVGTLAVQIAKALGAEITGVASARNEALVRSLGADQFVDYTREDFTQGDARYDLVLDNVGNRSFLDVRKVMQDDGVIVIVGGPKEGQWLGPIGAMLTTRAIGAFVSQRTEGLLAETRAEDLEYLAQLMSSGRLRSVIDRRYPLEQAAAAVEYVEGGRARGKVIVEVAR